MYRHNKLKEELDKLRANNRELALENTYLKEKINTLQAELYNVRLQMQNDSLHNTLMEKILLGPSLFKIEKDKSAKPGKTLEEISREYFIKGEK